MRLVLLAACASAMNAASAQSGPDVVISGEHGYLLSYPEVLSQPVVENFQWSSDGQYLLFVRTEAPTLADFKQFFTDRTKPSRTISAVVWNSATKKQQVLWRVTGKEQAELRAYWLQSSHSLVITTVGPTTNPESLARIEFIRADADSGKTEKIYSAESNDGNELLAYPSPLGPIAAVMNNSEEVGESAQGTQIWFVKPKGPMPRPIRMPGRVGHLVWDKEGKPSFLLYPMQPQQEPSLNFYAIDLSTGKTTKLTTPPESYEPRPPQTPIEARAELADIGTADSPRKSGVGRLVAQTKSNKMAAFIAADIGGVRLAPKLDFVAYISQGILAVRPILRMKASELEDALDAAEREVLMSNARQVGLAALMYAADWDDVLPGANADIRALILPYAKNNSMLDGFVYTFAGGLLSGISNPSEVELGHIPGKGGRAVIYLDGHVKWVKN